MKKENLFPSLHEGNLFPARYTFFIPTQTSLSSSQVFLSHLCSCFLWLSDLLSNVDFTKSAPYVRKPLQLILPFFQSKECRRRGKEKKKEKKEQREGKIKNAFICIIWLFLSFHSDLPYFLLLSFFDTFFLTLLLQRHLLALNSHILKVHFIHDYMLHYWITWYGRDSILVTRFLVRSFVLHLSQVFH